MNIGSPLTYKLQPFISVVLFMPLLYFLFNIIMRGSVLLANKLLKLRGTPTYVLCSSSLLGEGL